MPIDHRGEPPAAQFDEPLARHGDGPARVLAALVHASAAAFTTAAADLADVAEDLGMQPQALAAVLDTLWPAELQRLRELVPTIMADLALTAPDAAATAWH